MKTVAQNRKARFDYDIVDTIEVGIILTGQEVKSCREGNMNLSGSYVSFQTGKPVLKAATIAKYRLASGADDYEPGKDRILLMKKNQGDRLQTQLEEKGVSLVPLEVKAGRYIKVVLGLGKGKKKYD
ncbi:MAG: SsrA-binding protein, partial [Candidatus Peregrinibacteria bacterium]|nr:SsrA-binding protein [Candidatus Peregrinibacteria bacterium]